jgi:hypothetical protein
MAIHKLHLDEFDETNYQLIAIHTSLEDYRLAYFINQKLPIVLSKCKNDIQIQVKDGESQFVNYVYEDKARDIQWNLIQNKNEITPKFKIGNQGLFAETQNNFITKAYLLPELKKVDYFLKIENLNISFESSKLTTLLNTIERVSTVYTINVENIKSKNNLIF